MKVLKRTILTLTLLHFCFGIGIAEAQQNASTPTFKKIVLDEKFYCEGIHFADFNKDGHLDVVAGPFWFEGPNFDVRHEYADVHVVDPEAYSNFFFCFTGDINEDGWTDIVTVGFPSAEAYWYENPQGKDGPWKKTLAVSQVGNESPVFVDMNGDGRPDLLHVKDGLVGWSSYDPKHPYAPWTFHAISEPQHNLKRTGHGIGYGKISPHGPLSIVVSEGWFEDPRVEDEIRPWEFHPYNFADAGAHLLVFDVDGDGLNDVVTSWNCHHYGLLWYRQIRDADDWEKVTWEKHEILPVQPDLNSDALRISQLHAFDIADFNGDGRMDFVTGKRKWAHGSKGDSEPNAPFVLYWFENTVDANGKVVFVPHLVDDHSGVGTQVTVGDLNKDGKPDILSGNKNGIFVFLNEGK
jgi:hypothetical protein